MSEIEQETETTEIVGAAESAATADELGAPEAAEVPTEVVPIEEIEEAASVAEAKPTEAKPKRRIRSTTLFTAAVVLGVLGGVGTGYGIQYARPATPLPSLAGAQPAYAPSAVYQGVAPAMLPAAQDDATLTDGDLTKLLLPVPAGASTDDDLWVDQLVDIEEVAQLCTRSQATCLTYDYAQDMDAAADTSWEQGGFNVEIRMYRMAAGESGNARNWASGDSGEANQIPIPAGIDGSAYEFFDTNNDNDDNAYAVHGDLVVEIWVTSPSQVPNPSLIDGLLTQQMGRL